MVIQNLWIPRLIKSAVNRGPCEKIIFSGFSDGNVQETPLKDQEDLLIIFNDVLEVLVTFSLVIDLCAMLSHLGSQQDGVLLSERYKDS